MRDASSFPSCEWCLKAILGVHGACAIDIDCLDQGGYRGTRDMLREDDVASGMKVLAKGSRLSVQPVTEEEWKAVHKIAGVKPK